jgi:hypothetical protein
MLGWPTASGRGLQFANRRLEGLRRHGFAEGDKDYNAHQVPEVIDAIVVNAENRPSPQTVLIARHLGGAISRVSAHGENYERLVALKNKLTRPTTSISWRVTTTRSRVVRVHPGGGGGFRHPPSLRSSAWDQFWQRRQCLRSWGTLGGS